MPRRSLFTAVERESSLLRSIMIKAVLANKARTASIVSLCSFPIMRWFGIPHIWRFIEIVNGTCFSTVFVVALVVDLMYKRVRIMFVIQWCFLKQTSQTPPLVELSRKQRRRFDYQGVICDFMNTVAVVEFATFRKKTLAGKPFN